jgi:hypothetical protein
MEDKERGIKIAIVGSGEFAALAAIESMKLVGSAGDGMLLMDESKGVVYVEKEQVFTYSSRPTMPDVYIPRRINTDPFYYQFKNKRRKKH